MRDLVFLSRVRKLRAGYIPVHLYLESPANSPGRLKSVGRIRIPIPETSDQLENLVGAALQKWLTDGVFTQTVISSTLLKVLEKARLEGWRFLPKEGSTSRAPRFILTPDKA